MGRIGAVHEIGSKGTGAVHQPELARIKAGLVSAQTSSS
jgi:hypothetical protein